MFKLYKFDKFYKFQLGKDGRIRPVSGYKYRHSSNWIPSAEVLPPFYEETTTFPVNAAGTVIKKTTKSGSVTKVFVDEHMSAKSSRVHSTEIVNESQHNSCMKLNSNWKV